MVSRLGYQALILHIHYVLRGWNVAKEDLNHYRDMEAGAGNR